MTNEILGCLCGLVIIASLFIIHGLEEIKEAVERTGQQKDLGNGEPSKK